MKDTIKKSQLGTDAIAYTGKPWVAYWVSDDKTADMYMGEGDTSTDAVMCALAECDKVGLDGEIRPMLVVD